MSGAAPGRILQRPGYAPHELRCARGSRQVRRLRTVRRELPDGRAQAGRQALLQPGAGDAHALRPALDGKALQRRLPHQPHPGRGYRHGAVQDGVSRAYPRAGLHQARQPGQVPRGSGAHKEGEPVPGGLRPHMQPQVRGRLHPRRHRPAHRHRRHKEVHRRQGAQRRDPLRPADAQPDRQALHEQDRRHRRRPERPELRVLPRRQGLSRHRV